MAEVQVPLVPITNPAQWQAVMQQQAAAMQAVWAQAGVIHGQTYRQAFQLGAGGPGVGPGLSPGAAALSAAAIPGTTGFRLPSGQFAGEAGARAALLPGPTGAPTTDRFRYSEFDRRILTTGRRPAGTPRGGQYFNRNDYINVLEAHGYGLQRGTQGAIPLGPVGSSFRRGGYFDRSGNVGFSPLLYPTPPVDYPSRLPVPLGSFLWAGSYW